MRRIRGVLSLLAFGACVSQTAERPLTEPPRHVEPDDPPSLAELSDELLESPSLDGRWIRYSDRLTIDTRTGNLYAGSVTTLAAYPEVVLIAFKGPRPEDLTRIRLLDVAADRARFAARSSSPVRVLQRGAKLLYEPEPSRFTIVRGDGEEAHELELGGTLVPDVLQDAEGRQAFVEAQPGTLAWITAGDELHLRDLDRGAEHRIASSGAKIRAVDLRDRFVAIAWDDRRVTLHSLDGATLASVDGADASAVAARADGLAMAYSSDRVVLVERSGRRHEAQLQAEGFGAPEALSFTGDFTLLAHQVSGDISADVDYDLASGDASILSTLTPGTYEVELDEDRALCRLAKSHSCEDSEHARLLPRWESVALVSLDDGAAVVDGTRGAVLAEYGAGLGCGQGIGIDETRILCLDPERRLHVIDRVSARVVLETAPLSALCQSGHRLREPSACENRGAP